MQSLTRDSLHVCMTGWKVEDSSECPHQWIHTRTYMHTLYYTTDSPNHDRWKNTKMRTLLTGPLRSLRWVSICFLCMCVWMYVCMHAFMLQYVWIIFFLWINLSPCMYVCLYKHMIRVGARQLQWYYHHKHVRMYAYAQFVRMYAYAQFVRMYAYAQLIIDLSCMFSIQGTWDWSLNNLMQFGLLSCVS